MRTTHRAARAGFLCRAVLLGAALCSTLAATLAEPLLAQDFSREKNIATAVQIALPLIAGYCAFRHDQEADFLTGLATQAVVVEGLKYGLGDAPINRRPSGGDKGFPSGHSALAMFGATSIARKCVPDSPLLGAIAYGAAVAVAVSRVRTKDHTTAQVLTGLTIGYLANGVSIDLTDGGVGLRFSMSF